MKKKKLLSSMMLAGTLLTTSAANAANPNVVVTPQGAGVYWIEYIFSNPLHMQSTTQAAPFFGANPGSTCLQNCTYDIAQEFVTNPNNLASNNQYWKTIATKTNLALGSRIQWVGQIRNTITNTNSTMIIDPVFIDAKVVYGQRTLQAASGVLPGDTKLTIVNGDLTGGVGLRQIGVWINGVPVFMKKAMRRLDLEGITQPVVVDISALVPKTGEGTVVVEGIGDKDATANVVIGPASVSVRTPN